MTDTADEENNSPETILCKSCGLCCTGHLFSWVRLNANELNPAESIGLNVIRNDPRQRGFTQPCPLWEGVCTVYASPSYPRGCRSYKCKQLKNLIEENTSLPNALVVVRRAKELIHEMEKHLPASSSISFRERLIAKMGNPNAENADAKFRQNADALLVFFDEYFGVNDFFDKPEN